MIRLTRVVGKLSAICRKSIIIIIVTVYYFRVFEVIGNQKTSIGTCSFQVMENIKRCQKLNQELFGLALASLDLQLHHHLLLPILEGNMLWPKP